MQNIYVMQIMTRMNKYSYGSSSHQSSGMIMEKMQQEIHLGKSTGKAKSKVQHSVKAKMKVEDSYTVHIKSSTKVEMAGTIFQPSVKIIKEKMEMIEYSNSSGHTNRNVGQLRLPSIEISTAHDSDRKRKRAEVSKGQGKNTRPVKKSSNQRSGSCTCHTTKKTATKRTGAKTSTRKEQKSTVTQSSSQLSCTYGDVFVDYGLWDDDDEAFY
ncbi:hypothetical protein F2P56_009000 [Juglans regia]|uniref:Uncharacterized protein n=1 Tax=Juglans regia TaxID=51240 RepID=A0A834D2B6_JUGRE|nr:hypothetical protein F2P56_009000 [Juglans regia]